MEASIVMAPTISKTSRQIVMTENQDTHHMYKGCNMAIQESREEYGASHWCCHGVAPTNKGIVEDHQEQLSQWQHA